MAPYTLHAVMLLLLFSSLSHAYVQAHCFWEIHACRNTQALHPVSNKMKGCVCFSLCSSTLQNSGSHISGIGSQKKATETFIITLEWEDVFFGSVKRSQLRAIRFFHSNALEQQQVPSTDTKMSDESQSQVFCKIIPCEIHFKVNRKSISIHY